jgi:hypothetical protein
MCARIHNDPNDRASNLHIATCYNAYEEYWDRDGLVSEEQFDQMSTDEILAELTENGGREPEPECNCCGIEVNRIPANAELDDDGYPIVYCEDCLALGIGRQEEQ